MESISRDKVVITAALTGALKNFAVPGHDHFLTTDAGGKNEWWDVISIGVTDKSLYKELVAGQNYDAIKALIKAKDKSVVGPVPTDIFRRLAPMTEM